MATQLQKMQWQAQRPKRVNFDSGLEYNRAVATWRASDPAKMQARVSRGTQAPVTKPAVKRDITLPPPAQLTKETLAKPQPAPTTTVAARPPILPIQPRPAPPLINRKEIIGVDKGPLLPDMGPGDRLGEIKPSPRAAMRTMDLALERQEIEQAKSVSLAPTKTVTPLSPATLDLAPDTSAFAPLPPGPPPPEAIVEPVGETPPSEAEIQQVLERTAQRAAESEIEARRQLFYRGQVKRRGGMRMLFGKYAFPSPRQLAPATAEQLSKASKTVKALVRGRLGGLVTPERASYLKESAKEGYMGLGGEISPFFRG